MAWYSSCSSIGRPGPSLSFDYSHIASLRSVANRFSNKDRDWIVTFVKEPLTPAWTAMLFANTSPYMERFNVILRRIFEEGLVEYWHDGHRAVQSSVHYFKSAYDNSFRKRLNKLRDSKKFRTTSHRKIIKLNKPMVLSLIFGYFVAGIVLIIEMIWWRFRNIVIVKNVTFT